MFKLLFGVYALGFVITTFVFLYEGDKKDFFSPEQWKYALFVGLIWPAILVAYLRD